MLTEYLLFARHCSKNIFFPSIPLISQQGELYCDMNFRIEKLRASLGGLVSNLGQSNMKQELISQSKEASKIVILGFAPHHTFATCGNAWLSRHPPSPSKTTARLGCLPRPLQLNSLPSKWLASPSGVIATFWLETLCFSQPIRKNLGKIVTPKRLRSDHLSQWVCGYQAILPENHQHHILVLDRIQKHPHGAHTGMLLITDSRKAQIPQECSLSEANPLLPSALSLVQYPPSGLQESVSFSERSWQTERGQELESFQEKALTWKKIGVVHLFIHPSPQLPKK